MKLVVSPSFSPCVLERVCGHGLIRTVGELREYKGKQMLYSNSRPDILSGFRNEAIIESVESSNRLEGIELSRQVLADVVLIDKVDQRERQQGEVAGYRDVLAQIHESHAYMHLSSNLILQFHRDLFQRVGGKGGQWKRSANRIRETRQDGQVFVRFVPPDPWEVEHYMKALQESFAVEMDRGRVEPLILAMLYVLDFLCIHPFSDGNGRLARLLAVLLLYREGYDICRYISLERIIENHHQGYYDTLLEASGGWSEGKHDPLPWVDYMLCVIVLSAYRELERKLVSYERGYGVKKALVEEAFRKMPIRFKIRDLRAACPSVSDDTIRSFLVACSVKGEATCLGKGRYAVWEKSS